MDKIKKKISLEDFKIRSPKQHSGDTENWGKISKNFEIDTTNPLYQIKDKLPLSVSIEGTDRNILMYGTMIKVLTWLENFIKNSKIYTVCKRENDIKLVDYNEIIENSEGHLYTNVKYFVSKDVYVKKVWVVKIGTEYSEYDEYGNEVTQDTKGSLLGFKIAFNGQTIYETEESKIMGIKVWASDEYEQFLNYFKTDDDISLKSTIERAEFFLNYARNNKNVMGDSSNFITLKVMLNEECTDMGLFTANVKPWVDNKKYYLNDKIQDDEGYVWRLVKCKEGNKEEMEVPTVLNEFINTQLKNPNSMYKSINAAGTDLYDISGVTGVTNVYIKGTYPNFKYVRAYYNEIPTEDFWEICTDSQDNIQNSAVTSVTESKLSSLKRSKKDYDDNSEELPFIVKNADSGETELQYKENIPMNIINVGEKQYYDYIESIISKNNILYFKYYVGASMINGEKTSSGVLYEEEYPYTDETLTCTYNGKIVTFNYKKIQYENDLGSKKHYAKITISDDLIKSDDFQIVQYFKDENLMEVQKINKDINIKIERGKSAAFERHQILGEISSFDDLLTYRNGFFEIKSK